MPASASTPAQRRWPLVTVARSLYTLASLLAVALGAFAWWSWGAVARYEKGLGQSARVQAEILGRDFSEAFRARFEYHQYVTLAPWSSAGTLWGPETPSALFRSASSRDSSLIPVSGAFYWTSLDSAHITSSGMSPTSADAVRRRLVILARGLPPAAGQAIQMKVDGDGREIFALTYHRKRPDGPSFFLGVMSDADSIARTIMVPLFHDIAHYRLGHDNAGLAEWRVLSPGGRLLAREGEVPDGSPAVSMPFWRTNGLPDSAAAYRILTAQPTVSADVPAGPTDPARTPFLLEVRADPSRVAAALHGTTLPPAVPLVSLFAAGLVLTIAIVVLARRMERHVREREVFVTAVAHELRTPLTQILLHAETLQLDRPAVRTRQDASRVIVRETRRLIHLVENALQFARGTRSSARLNLRRIDVSQVVQETLDDLASVCLAAAVQVEPRIAPGVFVDADANAIRQMVVNLVDNAIRFGPQGQMITVGVSSGNGLVRVAVEDQGPGIRQADRERVFAPFVSDERRGGHGIGLAVVRQLAELHDGSAPRSAGPAPRRPR